MTPGPTIPRALRDAADDRLPDGGRRLVMIVGAGLNAAAAQSSGAAHSWAGLLKAVKTDLETQGVALPTSLPSSATAHWEALLRAVAASRPELSADGAERLLRNAVACQLRRFEEQAPQHPLFAEVLDWGLRDIVSLNFDLALVRAAGRQRLTHAVSREDLPALRRRLGRSVASDPSLYRRAELVRAAGITRVWYPHGDTGRAETLKLGVHAYGRTIGALEHAVGAYHREERHHRARGRGLWRDALRALPEGALSWATNLLAAPLLFVGVGLSHEEWPLWWLLHRRARLHARLPPEQRPGTWTLLRAEPTTSPPPAGDSAGGPAPRPTPPGAIPPHLVGSPAGLEVVARPDFGAVWATTRQLFTS